MDNKVTIIVVFSAILVLFFGMTLFDDTQAMKSKGNSLTEVSSKNVCGISLCDEPMTIQEKISLYLQRLQASESTILQQGALSSIGSVPLKSLPTTKMMEIPQLKAKSSESIAIAPPRPTPTPDPTTKAAETVTKQAEAIPKVAERLAPTAPPDVKIAEPVIKSPSRIQVSPEIIKKAEIPAVRTPGPVTTTPAPPKDSGIVETDFPAPELFITETDPDSGEQTDYLFSDDVYTDTYHVDSQQGAHIPIPDIQVVDYASDEIKTVNCSNLPSNRIFSEGMHTITCSYQDVAGKQVSASSTLTVEHWEPQLFVTETDPNTGQSNDYLIDDNSYTGAYHVDSAEGAHIAIPEIQVADYVENTEKIADCTNLPSNRVFSEGAHTITCSYQDVAGKQVSASSTLTIEHWEPQLFITISDPDTGQDVDILLVDDSYTDTYNADSAEGAHIPIPDIQVVDYVANEIKIAECSNLPANRIFPEGDNVFTCSYQDVIGKQISASSTLSVQTVGGPLIGLYDNSDGESFIPLSYLSSEVPAYGPEGTQLDITPIQAYDQSTGEIIDNIPCEKGLPPNNVFPIGVTEVSCSYTDSIGQSSSDAMIITVVDEPPELVMPDIEGSYPADDSSGLYITWPDIFAYDLVDGEILADCNNPSNDIIPIGRNNISCSATDSGGNTVSDSVTIMVDEPTQTFVEPSDSGGYSDYDYDDYYSYYGDETGEVIDEGLYLLVPEDAVLETDDPNGASIEFDAIAADVVDGELVPECDPSSGALFPVGETIITCSVTNSAGQTATDSFSLTILGPEIVLPDWIKTNADWWSQDIITNDEFTASIEYLIKNEIIVIPESEQQSSISESAAEIPNWIKFTASAWSQEAITDIEFVNALQYLIQEGIINVQ